MMGMKASRIVSLANKFKLNLILNRFRYWKINKYLLAAQ